MTKETATTGVDDSEEEVITPKLGWAQDCAKNADGSLATHHWYVPYPAEHPGNPVVDIEFVPGQISQGLWNATILNSFTVEVEGTIWDVEKVKLEAERIYSASIIELFKAAKEIGLRPTTFKK